MNHAIFNVMMGFLLISNRSFESFGFSTPRQRATALSMANDNSIFGNIPNPFGGANNDPKPPPIAPPPESFNDDEEFDSSPESLIARAKIVLSTNLGVFDPSILSQNFIWIGPQLGSSSIDKKDYIAAGKFFDIKAAFPDLDYRAHDFRIDSQDPMTVRLTARTTGTMRGKLRLRDEELTPNGAQMKCPPEAISITFDAAGKVSKICSGFVLDRLVGNTAGLCGVMAAATIGGSPPSDWEVYPATTVLGRFIGRPVKQLEDPTSFLAPFPETVMIQLAKGIFAANMASSDASLLRDDFTYLEPFDGPVDKEKYLQSYASQLFAGYEPELTHFRVDPYDPYRVWADVRAMGVTPEGVAFECPPQAFSFTFDDDGFCTRLTANAVMDPSLGNTGGLGGEEGIKYASGSGSTGIVTRPLPQLLGRLRKRLLEPVTKVGVDQFSKEETEPSPKASVIQSENSPPQKRVESIEEDDEDESDSTTLGAFFATKQAVVEDKSKADEQSKTQSAAKQRKVALADQQAKAQAAALAAAQAKKLKAEEARKKAQAAAAARQQAEEERKAKAAAALIARERQTDAATKAVSKAKEAQKARELAVREARRKAEEANAKAMEFARQRAEQAKKEKEEEEKKAKAAVEEAARLAKAKKVEEAKQKAEEERKLLAQAAADARLKAEEERKAKAEEAKRKSEAVRAKAAEAAKSAASNAKLGASIPLFGFGQKDETPTQDTKTKKAEEIAATARPGATISLFGFGGKLDESQNTKDKYGNAKTAKEAAAKAKPGATISLFGFGQPEESDSLKAKKAEKMATQAKPGSTISLFGLGQESKTESKLPTSPPATKAAQKAATAQPGATISLFGFGQSPVVSPAPKKRSAPKLSKAPPGVPSILNWKKRSDGGVSGLIYGSRNFDDGERVDTSPIVLGELENGSVVTTGSGSRYFLSNDKNLRRRKQKVSLKDVVNAKPGATITLTKQRKERDAQAAKDTLQKAERGVTISLFGLEIEFPGASSPTTPSPPKPIAKKTTRSKSTPKVPKKTPSPAKKKIAAPRGVPSVKKWRRNFDGSITGLVSGAKGFKENEKITTSKIISGKIASGEVVQTGSGSKYFLV